MRRLSLIYTLALGALLLSIGGHAQEAQEKEGLEQRVEALEKQLAEATALLAGLADTVQAETVTLDQLVRFAEAQAKSATEMGSVLDRSEQAGFTAGINFGSREILLAGWRKQLASIRSNAPGKASVKVSAKGDEKKEAKDKRGWRR